MRLSLIRHRAAERRLDGLHMNRARQARSPAIGATLGLALCCLAAPLRADTPQPEPPPAPAATDASPGAGPAPPPAPATTDASPGAGPAPPPAPAATDASPGAGPEPPAAGASAAPQAGPIANAGAPGSRDALDCDPDAATPNERGEPWQAVLARVGMSFTLAGLAVGGTTVPLGVISTRGSTTGELEGSSRLNLQLMAVTIGFPAAAVTLLGTGMWLGGALGIPDPDELDEEDDEDADKTAGAVVPTVRVGLGSVNLRLDF